MCGISVLKERGGGGGGGGSVLKGGVCGVSVPTMSVKIKSMVEIAMSGGRI